MSATHCVALIAPAHSYRASVFLRVAADHNISVVFVSDRSANIVPAHISGLEVNFGELTDHVQSICRQLEEFGVQAVIAPDEKYVTLAGKISQKLGLPHNSIESLRTASDKYLSRKQLKSAGIEGVPDFTLIDLRQDLDKQLSQVRFPCVAKPLNMSASRGVIRADHHVELKNALEVIEKILQFEFERGQYHEVIVEDYIGGTEHALEAYLSDAQLEVICLFDKPDPLHGPYFEETYYITPSRLDESIQEQIRATVLSGCLAIGLSSGPVHAEVRLFEGKVWILEIAPRSIGGDCGRLFELTTNSSIEEFVLNRAVGREVGTLSLERAAGVLMIPITESGILRRVEGVTDAQSIDNILEVRIDVREGERLVRWPQGGKYPGYIYALADRPWQVESALRQSYEMLKFVTKPELPVVVH